MKRGKGLVRRSPLRRGTALKRTGPIKRKRAVKAFAKHRNKPFTKWLTTEGCLIAGHHITRAIGLHDVEWGSPWNDFTHVCWGPIDPAHVGKHRAQGVGDLQHTVPLCRAAHNFYDDHRSEWSTVTGFTEEKMQAAADGYAGRYLTEDVALPLRGRA